MSIEVEYQKGLYTALNAAKTSLGVVGVYDTAPTTSDGGDRSAFPYIVVGDINPIQLDTQTVEGFQVTSRIHIFSRSGSMLQTKTIQAGMYGLLHRTPFAVTGFNHYSLLRNDTECRADMDGKMHGICEYVGLAEVSS